MHSVFSTSRDEEQGVLVVLMVKYSGMAETTFASAGETHEAASKRNIAKMKAAKEFERTFYPL